MPPGGSGTITTPRTSTGSLDNNNITSRPPHHSRNSSSASPPSELASLQAEGGSALAAALAAENDTWGGLEQAARTDSRPTSGSVASADSSEQRSPTAAEAYAHRDGSGAFEETSSASGAHLDADDELPLPAPQRHAVHHASFTMGVHPLAGANQNAPRFIDDANRTLDSLDGVRHAKLLRRSVVSASQIARVQARNDELREMFDLPKQGSQLLEDYNCALQKKILLQGRMFVFEEYVCFHANIFGYVKTKVMPLNEVTSVRRCKHVGFPNSIEFYFRGRREFFTSFLSRDDAYWLVVSAWSACSNYARMYFGAHFSDALGVAHRHHRHSTPELNPHNREDTSSTPKPLFEEMPRSETGDSIVWSSDAGTTEGSQRSEPPSLPRGESEPVAAPRQRARSEMVPRPSSDDASIHMANSGDGRNRLGSMSPPLNRTLGGQRTEDGAVSPDEDAEEGADGLPGRTVPRADLPFAGASVEEDAPPAIAADAQCIADEQFPLTPERFFRCIFSDVPGSDGLTFFARYHTRRGDQQVRCSPWRASLPIGILRDLSFRSVVSKWSIGASLKAGCTQTQRYRVFHGGSTLLFETSQTMADIPYGDYFTVETRWEVKAIHGGGCHVKVYCSVPFSKSTMLRSQIVRGAFDESRAGHVLMLKMARESISQMQVQERARLDAEQRSAAEMQNANDDPPSTPHAETSRVIANAPPEWRDTVAAMLQPTSTPSTHGPEEAQHPNSHPSPTAAAPAPASPPHIQKRAEGVWTGVLTSAMEYAIANPVLMLLAVLNVILMVHVLMTSGSSRRQHVSPHAQLTMLREELALVKRLATSLEANLGQIEARFAQEGACGGGE